MKEYLFLTNFTFEVKRYSEVLNFTKIALEKDPENWEANNLLKRLNVKGNSNKFSSN